MTHLLHLDASARPGLAGKDEHGSHSRNLSQRFISQWLARRPQDGVTYRDIGRTRPLRQPRLDRVGLHARGASTTLDEGCPGESDRLVDELLAADVLVIGTPLYNFGMPAALKAWIDQVVRLNRTVGLDESNPLDPYVPMLADRERHAVILTARGGVGFGPGGRWRI